MINFGESVILRAFDENALPKAFTWRNDPSIWRWTRQNDLLTSADHEDWFDGLHGDKTVKMYSVFSKPEKAIVGVCGLTSINLKNRNAEFSLYIGPEFGRRGYGRAALKTLFYHGFQNMGLKSIWGETFEGNPAKDLFSSIGMIEDGRRRQFYWKDGRFIDAVMISILDTEFQDLHGAKSCFIREL